MESNAKTKAIACRVSLKAHAVLVRRAKRMGLDMAKYLKQHLETDALRKR